MHDSYKSTRHEKINMAVWYITVVRHHQLVVWYQVPGTTRYQQTPSSEFTAKETQAGKNSRTVEHTFIPSLYQFDYTGMLPGAQGYEIRLTHSCSLEEEEAPLTSMDNEEYS